METISFAKLGHIFYNIFEAVFFKWDISMVNTVWCPYACEEKSIEVVYLRDSTYGRSWIIRHGFLMDGDRRRESPDLSNMGRLRDV